MVSVPPPSLLSFIDVHASARLFTASKVSTAGIYGVHLADFSHGGLSLKTWRHLFPLLRLDCGMLCGELQEEEDIFFPTHLFEHRNASF